MPTCNGKFVFFFFFVKMITCEWMRTTQRYGVDYVHSDA